MLGGGTFISQNKKLPGSYINFVNAKTGSATMSDRGVVAMALELDWGIDNEVFKVTSEDFIKNSLKIFGYDYSHEKMKGLRDLFLNATTLYAYRLNSGEQASNTYAKAKCSGIRGNDLKIVIQKDVDNETKFVVKTYFDTKEVDSQIVTDAKGLVDNDYVEFIKSATLEITAGAPLAGGTNGSTIGDSHQSFLDKIESYGFNAIATLSEDETVRSLYVAFTKRLREEVGSKFQAVLYNKSADYEGIVNVANTTVEGNTNLVYWVTGIIAGCSVNSSNTNKLYDGEFTVNADYTKSQLEDAIDTGKFILHKMGDEITVLEDKNSLVATTDDKGEDFKSNQVIRVIDQYAKDIANIFNNSYIGNIQNDADGRTAFWNDIVTYCQQLQTLGAIQDFSEEDVSIAEGNDKKTVAVECSIEPVCAMSKLYMTVVVE